MMLKIMSSEPTCARGTVPPVARMSLVQATPTRCSLGHKSLAKIWVLSANCRIYAPACVTLKGVVWSDSVCSVCSFTIKLVCFHQLVTNLTLYVVLVSDIPSSLKWCVCGCFSGVFPMPCFYCNIFTFLACRLITGIWGNIYLNSGSLYSVSLAAWSIQFL